MRRVSLRTTAVMLATAAGVAWLAVDSGTYSVSDRTAAAIVIWWALGLAVAVGVLPTGALRGWTLAAAGLLAAFAAWNAASIAWAPSAERAYDEFTRVLLYLGIFLLVALMASAVGPSPIADGIALGIVAIAVLALADRFFPGLMSHHDVIQFAPGTQARLAYPIGYWNGLGIFVALGLPLLLRRAVGRDSVVVRAAAVAPIPVLAAVIYLASSRGAVGVLAVGAVAFLLLTPRRWAAAGALAVGAAGAAAAIAVLRARPELVDGPVGSAAATSPGHSAAALVLSICLVAGALHAAGVVLLDGRVHIPRSVSLAAVGAAAALLLAGFALAHPVRRFDEFKRPQAADAYAAGNNSGVIEEHLLSTGGNARWQLWASALDAFQREPLHGLGAGSFEEWWAQHGTVAGFVRDAHSLYAETLGELGIVGLALLLGFFGAALGGGIVRYAAGYDESRLLHAALLATFAAFAAGAAVDWIWELGAVGAVGIAALALASATLSTRDASVPLRVAVAAAASLVIGLAAIPFLSQAGIEDSQAALVRGDVSGALTRAADARDVQPWAASPYVQLALVEERAGSLSAARRCLVRAIDRDRQDWRLRLILTRIETQAGHIRAARASLARARALNPRSPVLKLR